MKQQKTLFGENVKETLKQSRQNQKRIKRNKKVFNQKPKKTTCQRCYREISVFTLIKKRPMCYDCYKDLKKYFEKKNNTAGKNISLCSCCKKFKEIGYTDSYPLKRIEICNNCIETFAPYLKDNVCPKPSACVGLGQKISFTPEEIVKSGLKPELIKKTITIISQQNTLNPLNNNNYIHGVKREVFIP